MELKLASQMHLNQAQASSNRTFMELKYSLGVFNKRVSKVLIVPLWN